MRTFLQFSELDSSIYPEDQFISRNLVNVSAIWCWDILNPPETLDSIQTIFPCPVRRVPFIWSSSIASHYSNKKYVIMQLSLDYVGLFDYDKLELLRKVNLSVTKTSKNSNPNAKYYCIATINNRSAKIHNIITDYDMVDHINHYPLDNRFENLSLTNPRENNNHISKILNKKIEKLDNKFNVTIKYLDLNVKFNECKTLSDSKSFDTKNDAYIWLENRIKEIDCKRDYDNDVIEYTKSYEEIMTKYSDNFKWHNNNSNDNSESDNNTNFISNENDHSDNQDTKKLSKFDKYKQFKDIDPDFTMQKYDVNLKSNTISHLKYQDIEYKFCSKCHNWNNITNYDNKSNNNYKHPTILEIMLTF